MNTANRTVHPSDHPVYSSEMVGPEQAKRYLANMVENRNLNAATVDSYARTMREGAWHTASGQPIKFLANGKLFDGQHRLAAIVKASISIVLEVARGFDQSAMHVVDNGRTRSAADVLALGGEKYASTKASIARLIYIFERGLPLTNIRAIRVSNNQIAEVVRNHPELTEIIDKYDTPLRHCGILKSIGFFAVWWFRRVDPVETDRFFEEMSEMPTDTILVFIRRLQADRALRRSTTQEEHLALFVKTWNAWRTKKHMKLLKWSSSEDMPIPQ